MDDNFTGFSGCTRNQYSFLISKNFINFSNVYEFFESYRKDCEIYLRTEKLFKNLEEIYSRIKNLANFHISKTFLN